MTNGQSCKQFTLVNYDSRVVPDLKTPHITTLESYTTIVKCFIILTTSHSLVGQWRIVKTVYNNK